MTARERLLWLLLFRMENSAHCLGCGGTFFLWDLTNAFACSYLCIPCAERFEKELFG